MTISPLSDEELMHRYCAGDLHAFKELYRRHSAGLYRFIAWRSPRKDWVAEIVQDSWAALHGARASYTASASFKTYLYQIARNRLLDLLRQKQEQLGDEFDADSVVSSHDNSPDNTVEKQQQIAILHLTIQTLPCEQKEALVLQQFNGMSLDEIALITGVSAETVKSRLRYAMNKLRAQLQLTTGEGV